MLYFFLSLNFAAKLQKLDLQTQQLFVMKVQYQKLDVKTEVKQTGYVAFLCYIFKLITVWKTHT